MLVPGAILMAVVIVFHFALITFGSPVMAPLGQGKGNKAMNYKELFLSFRIFHIVLTAVFDIVWEKFCNLRVTVVLINLSALLGFRRVLHRGSAMYHVHVIVLMAFYNCVRCMEFVLHILVSMLF